MSDYTKSTNFAVKDTLPTGDPAKVIKGTEFNVEFDNIATASATKANSNNAALTGTAAIAAANVAGNITVGGTVDGRDVATDGTKLDTIATNATADQTNAEIKTAYEANADTNAYNNASVTKLSNIETAATADQTGAEIKAAYEAEPNAFNDTKNTKLANLEAITGTGVTASYVSSVVVGGTTFNQGAVVAVINGDLGTFNVNYAGATGVSVTTLSSPSAYIYIDSSGNLQQQTTTPTRQDWVRKVFTMRRQGRRPWL